MAAVCDTHPSAPADTTCHACLRFICNACFVLDGLKPCCPECLRALRRSRRIRGWVVGAGAAVASGCLAFGGWRLYRDQRDVEPPFDYGKHTAKVRQLEGQLAREPCDRQKMLDLADAMLDAGDNRGALRRCDGFLQTCGEFLRLRWLTYEAHKRLSEWDPAAAEVTKLIESDPYDKDFRWWRGIVYEQKQDWDRAAEDYRQALALEPKLNSIPLNLATVYERAGRPCDAIFPLEQLLFYYPDARGADKVEARVERLAAAGACGSSAPAGTTRIRYDKAAGVIRTDARFNERETGSFLVDTGASYVTLGRAFAARLGLDLGRAPQVLLRTASGTQTGALASVDSIEVGAVRAARVPIVVVDGLGGVDGLLGLSFLSRFELHQADGTLEIVARSRR